MQHSYSHSKPPLLCTDWAQFGSANSASKQKRPKKLTSNKIILFVKNYLLITVRFLENTIICFLDCLAFITFWFILQLHVYKNCQKKHSKKHKKHYEIANCKKEWDLRITLFMTCVISSIYEFEGNFQMRWIML